MPTGFEKRIRKNPEWGVVKTFATIILLGTVLLALPVSRSGGSWTHPLTALFTATSATCVTGLTVVDTGTYFSRFGQVVILGLMQVGGLGIMTIGSFLLIVVGRQLSPNEEVVLLDAFAGQRRFGLQTLMLRAVWFTFTLELAGAGILSWRLHTVQGLAWGEACFSGIFHAVSALCNAGFALPADSLAGWRPDLFLMGTMMVLIVLGGLGFVVWHNLLSLRPWRRNHLRRGSLSLHSRLVLAGSVTLILVGWAALAMLEWGHSLQGLPWHERLVAALFQSITARTAGFSVVDMGSMAPPALFVTIMLMFVGGSPASMAGGIKITTAALLLMVIRSLFRGREDVEYRHRKIPDRSVREAQAVFMLGLILVSVFFLGLLTMEHVHMSGRGGDASEELLFETVSAFATVGLSTGITAGLSGAGKMALIALMFLGRLGPMTIALAIGRREVRQLLRCLEEEVLVG